jgi:hypothetical protein
MKFKSILLTAVATIGFTALTMAQVPNYVPTNGLVGWWPFNGNANDESGNGNNGTVNGASLAMDRFSQANQSYNFNGTSNYIVVAHNNSQLLTNEVSFSLWINPSDYSTNNNQTRVPLGKRRTLSTSGIGFETVDGVGTCCGPQFFVNNNTGAGGLDYEDPLALMTQTWTNLVGTYDGSVLKLYKNSVLIGSATGVLSLSNTIQDLCFGREGSNSPNNYFKGLIDDIGFWNRALSQQEVTDLFNATNCVSNTTITPQNNSLTTGNTATFIASTSDPNPSYVWQSDLGQGFQTLNNFGNYSGVNTNSLSISNVQLSEHNQPIRVITTSGNCIDTSNVALISILDTCITNVTIYDTLLTTVTDTLVINATITGINPPNNLNTLKVYPNPASTHITIDYGNFSAMSGYTLTIVNSIGQTVFTTPINQQTSYIDLSTWTGNGIYFVQLIDPQNNTIENRKIVIQ